MIRKTLLCCIASLCILSIPVFADSSFDIDVKSISREELEQAYTDLLEQYTLLMRKTDSSNRASYSSELYEVIVYKDDRFTITLNEIDSDCAYFTFINNTDRRYDMSFEKFYMDGIEYGYSDWAADAFAHDYGELIFSTSSVHKDLILKPETISATLYLYAYDENDNVDDYVCIEFKDVKIN